MKDNPSIIEMEDSRDEHEEIKLWANDLYGYSKTYQPMESESQRAARAMDLDVAQNLTDYYEETS